MKKGIKTCEKRLKTSEYKVEYVNPTNVLPYNTVNALARCWLEGCYTNEFMLIRYAFPSKGLVITVVYTGLFTVARMCYRLRCYLWRAV